MNRSSNLNICRWLVKCFKGNEKGSMMCGYLKHKLCDEVMMNDDLAMPNDVNYGSSERLRKGSNY